MEPFNLIQHGCSRCMLSYFNILRSYEQNYPDMVDRLTIINGKICSLTKQIKFQILVTIDTCLFIWDSNSSTHYTCIIRAASPQRVHTKHYALCKSSHVWHGQN